MANTHGNVIPARKRFNAATGRTISLYSNLPFGDADDWEIVTKGFTIAWVDGTEGVGRVPFETEAEAQAYLDKCPAGFRGMMSMGN